MNRHPESCPCDECQQWRQHAAALVLGVREIQQARVAVEAISRPEYFAKLDRAIQQMADLVARGAP